MMGDFDVKNGKVSKGMLSSILAAVKYLIIPAVIVTVLISLISSMGGDQFLPVDQLDTVRSSLIIFAIPVIAISFFVGFYPKGSYSRMTFGIVYVATVCVWLWFAALGGEIETSIEMVGLSVVYTPLLLLFIFALALKALIYVAEAPSYRKEFLRGVEERTSENVVAERPVQKSPQLALDQFDEPIEEEAVPGNETPATREDVPVSEDPCKGDVSQVEKARTAEKEEPEMVAGMVRMPRPGPQEPQD
jgi:hypothetical protein